MFLKTAVFLLAVALPAIHGFGLGGDGNMLASKLGSLLNNNRPPTEVPPPPPTIITISPLTPSLPPTSPLIYYTPTYIPTPFPVPVQAPAPANDEEILPANQQMADAVDQEVDGGRRRKRVQRVFPGRKQIVMKRKAARRNRQRG